MKKLIAIVLIITTAFTLQAQQLSGTQEYVNRSEYGGSRYSIINWSVNFRIFEEDNSFYIELSNPKVTPSTSSQYGIPGNFYSKSDLGISTWPNTDPTAYIFSLILTIKYPDGSSHEHNAEINRKNYIDVKNKFKNTNATASSFRVTSVEKMNYNGAHDQKLDELIAAKKNGNSNNNLNNNNHVNQTNINQSENSASKNTETKTTVEQIPESYKGNPMTYNKNNSSSAVDNFSKNYQQGQQIVDVATGLVDLFSASPEKKARLEREENSRIEKEEAAARARANKVQMIASRKRLINNYPDGKTPLSSQAKGVTEVYYFVYNYTQTELEIETPKMHLSEVFTSPKYGDGTWAFKKNVIEKVSRQNRNIPLILSGFYESKTEAEQKQNYFLRTAKNAGFEIVNLENVVVASSTATETTTTDYWGNPTAGRAKVETKTETPQITKKVEVDFWGNPIK